MTANVSHFGSAEHSVAQGMNQHIAVGMGNRAFAVRNQNTAQPEGFTPG
jgi:hypothetical protein